MKRYDLQDDGYGGNDIQECKEGKFVKHEDVLPLIEALKFYEREDHIKDSPCETYFGNCPKDVDHGETAREALKAAGVEG